MIAARPIAECVTRVGSVTVLSMVLAACATTRNPISPLDSSATPNASHVWYPPGVAHPPPDPRAIMVDGAMSMLGQPYRFGGAAPGGFDCSGLVVYVANGAGIRLPRTAQEQLSAGFPVARGELRAGDLVFLHLAHKELHVGIAIDNERFIHAPSKGGYVRIDTLIARPYARGFTSARRITMAP